MESKGLETNSQLKWGQSSSRWLIQSVAKLGWIKQLQPISPTCSNIMSQILFQQGIHPLSQPIYLRFVCREKFQVISKQIEQGRKKSACESGVPITHNIPR